MCRYDWFDDGPGSSSTESDRRRSLRALMFNEKRTKRSQREESHLQRRTSVSRRPWRFGYQTIRDKLRRRPSSS